ncbi:glycoside hydrolase family 127 protein [candidate division KSB1 bacterium]|nr:glycoside hydrolase family 127 protein [candidate division KSB1 bacterium]RQW08161.1 MAG: glycoside hydrolase family 127 protein [candidate division KSB1 bacterium]
MKYLVCLSMLLILACATERSVDYPIEPVPFTSVTLTDSFWRHRLETNRAVTIPSSLRKCQETGRIANFEIAAGQREGEFQSPFPFDDSDVYKIIEGASYSLATFADVELEAILDELIAKIAAAQEEDGYIMTWRTINPNKPPTTWSGTAERWSDIGGGHELYNAGHMYEAAVAHYQVTGKRNFLRIAIKNADLIASTFGPGKLMSPPGHEEIEIGLVKLYRATGDEKYLQLARFFIDQRGNAQGHELYGPYSQDHAPIFDQDEAVGHAVRAGYFYSGVADIAALTGERKYVDAIDRIWDNVVSKKLYITGGIGARRGGEAFGENYELPNATSYNETCAAIANVMWNQRMFLLKGDAKYLDVLERTLYNGLISGVSLDGDTFFYPNCLAFDGKTPFNQGATTRTAWFDCSCCPSNICRFIPSLPGYFYAQQQDTIYINLYAANEASLRFKGKDVKIIQETNYPWDGKIGITIDASVAEPFAVKLRLPGWAMGRPVPSDLYSYIHTEKVAALLTVNQEPQEIQPRNGFITLTRKWLRGDRIQLDLPMVERQVVAHALVTENVGRMALERGPIVYCAEAVDNAGQISDLALHADSLLQSEYFEHLLRGVVVLNGRAERTDAPNREQDFHAIPYYAWNHRGAGEMAVWLPIVHR